MYGPNSSMNIYKIIKKAKDSNNTSAGAVSSLGVWEILYPIIPDIIQTLFSCHTWRAKGSESFRIWTESFDRHRSQDWH